MHPVFFAVPIAPQWQQLLHKLITAERSTAPSKVHWTPAERWHLTLCYVDQLDPSQINTLISQAHHAIKHYTDFSIQPSAITTLGQPHHLVIKIQPQAILQQLYNALHQACQNCQRTTAHSHFIPHITVAKHWPQPINHTLADAPLIPCQKIQLLYRRHKPNDRHYPIAHTWTLPPTKYPQ
jgi:2'-5' RNA ligase